MKIRQQVILFLLVITLIYLSFSSCTHIHHKQPASPAISAKSIPANKFVTPKPDLAKQAATDKQALALANTFAADSETAKDALTFYNVAKDHFDSRIFLPAITEFTEFIHKYPNHALVPYANYHLAESYMALWDIDHAGIALCALQIKDRKTAEYFKDHGWAEAALAYLEKYLAQPLPKRKKAEAELQKGVFLQILNDGLGARNAFEKAYQLAPRTDVGIKALYYTGLSFLNEQTYSGLDAAKERFTLVMQKYPSNPVAVNSQFFLTVILYRLRTQDNRITPYEEFIKKYPNSVWTPRAYYLAGITAFEERRDYKTGFAYFNKTLDLLTTLNPNGDDPPVTYWQEAMLVPGDMLYKNWNFIVSIYLNNYGMESTLDLAKALQTSYPEEHGVHQLGKLVPLMILEWQRKNEELVKQVDEYLTQYPDPAKKWLENLGTALYLKAFALNKLGRDTEAIAVYNQLAIVCPETDCADYGLILMGKCYEDLNNIQNAILAYDRCISLFPGRHQVVYIAYLGKAKALAKLNSYQEAVATLDTFLLRWGNRYDCPKDAIMSAKQLKAEYQQKLGNDKGTEGGL